MTPRTKTAIAASLAVLVGLGAIAGFAHADMKQGHGHGMSRHHGQEMQSRIRAFAERYDMNKDGRITQDEVNANRAQWHAEFDKDKDGGLTLQEFQDLWLKARFERMVREFQRFDRNGDAKLTIEEYQGPLLEIVEVFDRNGDGVLSKEDRPRRGWRHGQKPATQGSEAEQPKPENQQSQ
jgi:Ca2+-binding EF-hand superfamily protein